MRKYSPLYIAGFIFGCITIAMMVVTACYAGEERIHLGNQIKVTVFSTDDKGNWHVRIGTIEEYTDAVVAACFEYKNSVVADCLVIIKGGDGEALMVPTRLREEKT
jgi:hypothetical protein